MTLAQFIPFIRTSAGSEFAEIIRWILAHLPLIQTWLHSHDPGVVLKMILQLI